MPNWCENDLTVTGPKEHVEEMLRRTWKKADDSDAIFPDFDRIIPYPQEFRVQDERAERDRKEMEEQAKAMGDENWRKHFLENKLSWPKDGFNSGGYEWCIANWGTKWPACDPGRYSVKDAGKHGQKVKVSFSTAWSPPLPVFARLSEMFPTLTIDLAYYECGAAFQGKVRFEKGEEASRVENEYHGNRGG